MDYAPSKVRYEILSAALFMCALVVPAARALDTNSAPSIDLTDTLRLAAQRPAVKAVAQDQQAANSTAEASSHAAFWPQFSLAASDTHTDNLPAIPTPGGNLALGDFTQRAGMLTLNQPLFQVAKASQAEADKDLADAASTTYTRSVQLNQFEGVTRYLDILSVESQLRALADLKTGLDAQAARLAGEEAQGRVLHADTLKVQVAANEAQQQIVALEQQLAVARQEFAIAIGQESAPAPAPLGTLPDGVSLANVAAISGVSTDRADVIALADETKSYRVRAAGASEQGWPTVSAFAQYDRYHGVPTYPDHQTEVGVQLSWTIFSGDVYSKQQDAYEHQANALDQQTVELRRRVSLDIQQAEADYTTATSVRDLAQTAVASAQETYNTRSALYDYGRATIDEVLDADADLAKQKAVLDVARINIVRAWFSYQLAVGRDLAVALNERLQQKASQ